MPSYPRTGPSRRGLRTLALAALLPALACSNVDNILDVSDPDIIDPRNVSTPAGANAVRLGTLSRFIGATSGDNGGSSGETLWMYSGLLADEFRSGDTFNQRDQTDQRVITYENANIENGYIYAHRARVSAIQALAAMREFVPDAPTAQLAELYLVQAYTENMLGEMFCSGVPFSSVVGGVEEYGQQLTTAETFERALAHADSGLALVTGTTAADGKVRHALSVTKGRILVNLERYADAAAAVAEVPPGYAYVNEHSETTRDNVIWDLVNNGRRYVVADGEGTNGIDFARAADPRLPICVGGSDECRAVGVTNSRPFDSNLAITMYAQLKWPERGADAAVADYAEAQLIVAEAQLAAGDAAGARTTLNALRAAEGLEPLDAVDVDVLFEERAFWLFGTGHRLGDLRRLVRQYDRNAESVFPTGAYFKGGTYGTQTSFPIPQAEENNPNIGRGTQDQICLDTGA